MKHTHAFNATKKQYETKFKQWHMTQNLGEEEWKAIIEHFNECCRRGREDAAVMLHGRRLPDSKVKKVIQRHSQQSLHHHIGGDKCHTVRIFNVLTLKVTSFVVVI
ncbi:hypothetical protein B0T14DRAFT_565033 [Immersiella caudata]|uniref:Clr5 domain-containing protein n=1 Tax=Immersiella caudata TaxID=314043 RepID=A0AA39WY07_9PEZI|nr:hypothetical protein B0T14DRAFT_565033 [Immersiella caudata]